MQNDLNMYICAGQHRYIYLFSCVDLYKESWSHKLNMKLRVVQTPELTALGYQLEVSQTGKL